MSPTTTDKKLLTVDIDTLSLLLLPTLFTQMKSEMPKFISATFLIFVLAYPIKCTSLSNSSSNSNSFTSVNFIGKSSSQITVPLSAHPLSHHFPLWLSSKHSHHHLLGTSDVTLRDDGAYHCKLPSLSFFGLKIKPTCVSIVEHDKEIVEQKEEVIHFSSRTSSDDSILDRLECNEGKIEKDNVSIKVTIQESMLQIDSSSESIGTIIESLMELCKLHGGNRITCTRQHDSWLLSSDLELRLNLFLGTNANGKPKFLPPGFRSIGERILMKTCEKRVQDNLNSIKDGFEDYLIQLQRSEQSTLMSPLVPPR